MAAKIVRDQGLDKFYTRASVAKMCIDTLNQTYPLSGYGLVVEPSAGNGSFLHNIDHCSVIGIDIEPEDESIMKMDFFDFKPEMTDQRILVIGNPPFGKCSSIAVKFFIHAAEWADTIAFIIPKTFRKCSIQNRLPMHFHLIKDIEIPNSPCAFVPTMSVKCCFQIWQKQQDPRSPVRLPESHSDWTFLKHGPKDSNNQPTPPKNADFAIRAYGGKIGFIQTTNLEALRPKSWHWIKSNIDPNELRLRFETLDYSNSVNTARQNSMGKKELIQLYIQRLNSKL